MFIYRYLLTVSIQVGDIINRLTEQKIMNHPLLKQVVTFLQGKDCDVKPSDIRKAIPEYKDYRMLRRHLRILEREGVVQRNGDKKPTYRITDEGIIEIFHSLYPLASIETKLKIARQCLDYIIPETCIIIHEKGA